MTEDGSGGHVILAGGLGGIPDRVRARVRVRVRVRVRARVGVGVRVRVRVCHVRVVQVAVSVPVGRSECERRLQLEAGGRGHDDLAASGRRADRHLGGRLAWVRVGVRVGG